MTPLPVAPFRFHSVESGFCVSAAAALELACLMGDAQAWEVSAAAAAAAAAAIAFLDVLTTEEKMLPEEGTRQLRMMR